MVNTLTKNIKVPHQSTPRLFQATSPKDLAMPWLRVMIPRHYSYQGMTLVLPATLALRDLTLIKVLSQAAQNFAAS